ncbi:hypothetical protein BDV19DRAFT_5972 [Aspergillus venezuelensis]
MQKPSTGQPNAVLIVTTLYSCYIFPLIFSPCLLCIACNPKQTPTRDDKQHDSKAHNTTDSPSLLTVSNPAPVVVSITPSHGYLPHLPTLVGCHAR